MVQTEAAQKNDQKEAEQSGEKQIEDDGGAGNAPDHV
jgi:hypothetical protein